jgi:hypothetical protein
VQVLPIDLESIIAIVMGISIVLIPVAGITARFALKPTVEAFSRLFEHKGLEETVSILERRMSLLETQMESMDLSLGRIADAVEFDRELRVGHYGHRPALQRPPESPGQGAPGPEGADGAG